MTKDNAASTAEVLQKAGLFMASLFFVLAIMINTVPFLDGRNDLMDFGSFYAAGLKSKSGENPYDPNSEYIFEIDFSRVGAGGKMMNLNPPVSVIVFEHLSQFDPHRALVVWQIVSAGLYAACVLALAFFNRQSSNPLKLVWAFALAGFWHTLVLGQVYILLLAFAVLGWVALQRGRFVLAGIAIGIVIAIKPNFLVWCLFLIVSGFYMAALLSVLVSLLISAVPLLFFGTAIYSQWLEASSLTVETLTMPGNNSLLGLTARFETISLGLVASAVFIIVLLILSRLKTSENLTRIEYISALGIIASLLASPISWTGYTILLLPIFFSLRKWTLPVTLSAIILAVPFQIILQFFQTSFASFVIFGWFYGWAILLLFGSLMKGLRLPGSTQTS